MVVAESQPRERRLLSPGEGIYRVRLSQQRGNHSAAAFFAGSQAEETVELPDGEYWVVVEDVTSGSTSARFPLSLRDVRTAVPLGPPPGRPAVPKRVVSSTRSLDHRASTLGVGASGDLEKKGFASRTGPRTARRSQDRDDRNDSEFRTGLSGHGGPFDPSPRRRSNVPFRPHRTQTRFEVAISEDAAPGATGGWRAPEGLTTRRIDPSSPGMLAMLVEGAEPRTARVRMSVGIEGRPTIRVPLPLFSGGLEVHLRSMLVEGAPDVTVTLVARDVRVRALMAALGDLSSDEALAVINWAAGEHRLATEVLHRKVEDLWAATVAGLVLIRSGGVERVASWMHNLARLAPHISDASIAAAWTAIACPDGTLEDAEERAMDYLVRARRIGAPTFVVGNSLALDLLSSLRLTGATAKLRRRAAAEYDIAAKRSRFRLYRSPYMIWEQRGEKLQGGSLPGTRYLSIARGSVTSQGFDYPGPKRAKRSR